LPNKIDVQAVHTLKSGLTGTSKSSLISGSH